MTRAADVQAHVAETETLIVSDLHLGLPVSRPRELLHLLQTVRFERLILLGDVFHDLGFRQLCEDTHTLLDHVHALREGTGAEVVWIAGNHDRHLAPLIRSKFGIEVREDFTWTCGGSAPTTPSTATGSTPSSPATSASAGWSPGSTPSAMRRLSTHGRWPARLDRLSVALTGLGEEVAEGVQRFALANPIDVIVCGHTHEPHHRVLDVAGPAGRLVEYVNSGAWLERPTFLSVDADGVRINRPPPSRPDPSRGATLGQPARPRSGDQFRPRHDPGRHGAPLRPPVRGPRLRPDLGGPRGRHGGPGARARRPGGRDRVRRLQRR